MAGKSDKFRIPFFQNLGSKFIALLLALLAWYGIEETTSFEAEVTNIPFTIQVDPGYAVLQRTANSIDVLFRGSKEDLRYLDKDLLEVNLDIRGKSSEGMMKLEILPRHIKAPGGARVLSVNPSEVSIRLDQEGEKEVPVELNLVGELQWEMVIEETRLEPETVVLLGPKQRLKEIESIRTEPIDLAILTQTFQQRVPLQPPRQDWVPEMKPDKVSVELIIGERTSTRELEEVPVFLLANTKDKFRMKINPSEVKVKLLGLSEVVDELNVDDLIAYVHTRGLTSDVPAQVAVQIETPEGVQVLSVEPKTVEINKP